MDYLTIKEVSILWSTTEQMVRRHCREGRIPGAVQREGSWYVPENAVKPQRKKTVAPTLPKFVKQLQRQRTKKIYHGFYDYIQVNFCYSSNRLASNRLLLIQVEEVYKTGKVSTGFEPIKVDDLIEAYNHFACVSYIIDTAAARISHSYIRKLHTMLSYGTMAERKLQFHPDEYRRDACTLGKTKTALFTPCLKAQARFQAQIDLQKLQEYAQRYKPVDDKED